MTQESYCRTLIRRCSEVGNEDSWREFVRRFRRPVERGILRALHGSSQDLHFYDREDLMQDVFCRLLDHGRRRLRWCRGRTEDQIAAYLCRVAETVTIDHLRAQSALKRRPWAPFASASHTPHGDPIALVKDPSPGPEERCLHRELRGILVRRCEEALPAATSRRDIEILRLAVVEGWSSRDIAARLGGGLSVSGIDSVIYRLRRSLQRQGLSIPRRSHSPRERRATWSATLAGL